MKKANSSLINRFLGKGIALLTFALFLFPGSDLKASHIVGGDITYKCLGNNNYEITLNVFRDCFYGDPEAWFDNPAYVGIYRKSTNTLFQQVNMPFSGINDTLSNFITDTCLFVPPAVCVHATQYKKVVTIPYLPEGYELRYVRCCRNLTINNIVDPYYTGATFTVTLTGQAMQECNTAPNFGGIAPIYICVNQPLVYDHSATEPNGDSLVYKLTTPYTGGTFNFPQPPPPALMPALTEVDWLEVLNKPYYNVDNMLGAEDTPPDLPLAIDPVTGVLTAFPTKIGQFVVGISVEEYRDGVLLSTVRRDFQYNVGECGEVIASILAPDVQCDDLTVEFGNESTFADEFIWYFDWGGDLSLTSSETTPTFTFPDTGWYTVMLIAEPTSVCVDTSFHQIFLQDNSLFSDFDMTVFDCVDTSVIELTDLSYDNVSPVVFWLWEVEYGMTTQTSNQPNPVFQVPLDVSGTVTLTTRSQNGCERSVSRPFVSGTNAFPGSLIADSHTLCQGDSAELNPQADSLGGYPFWWEPDELFADPTLPNQTVSPESTTVYSVYVTAVDSICYARTDITVTILPLPELGFDFGVDCNGVTVHFTNTSLNSDGYFWDFGDPSTNADTSSLANPVYTYPDTGTFLVTLMTGQGAFCKDTLTTPVELFEAVLAADFSFSFPDCEEDEVNIQLLDQSFSSLNDITEWNWTFSNGQTSSLQNPSLTLTQSQVLTATLAINTALDCKDTISYDIPVELTTVNLADTIILCYGDTAFLNPFGNTAFAYNWFPSTGLSDPTADNPQVFATETTTYNVEVTNFTGDTCQVSRSVTVVVPPLIELDASGGAVVACNEPVTLEVEANLPGLLFVWTDVNGNTIATGPSVVVSPANTTTYYVTGVDPYGCTGRDTVVVTVPNPVEVSLEGATISCHEEVVLEAVSSVGNLTYQWYSGNNPVGGDSSTLWVNPGSTTVFSVIVTDAFGCQAIDILLVTVPPAIEMEVTPDTVACEGPVLISASGNVPLDFEWWSTGPDTTAASQISVLPDTTGWYYVLGTDNFGCEALDSVFVANGIVDIQTTGQIILCPVPSTQLEVINTDPFDVLSYVWTAGPGGTILSSDTLTEIIVSTIPGVTDFTVVATNQFGCSGSVTATVLTSNFEPVIGDSISICAGIPTPINPLGNPNYTYNWEPVVGGIDPSDPNPVATLSTSQTFTVTITDFQGVDTCSAVLEVTVLVNPDIELDAQGDTTLCEFIPTTLTATTAVSPVFLTWFDDPALNHQIGIGNSIVVEPEGAMTYYVLAEDALGCLDTDTVQINAFPIDISALPQYDLCIGEDMTIEVINNAPDQTLTYDWQPVDAILEGGNTATPLVNPLASATFTVVVENQYGCVDSASTFVNVVDVLTGLFATADPDTIYFNSGVPSQLETIWNEDYAYNWWPDESLSDATIFNPLATPNETTVYYVEVMETISEAGCRGVDSVVVVVLDPPCEPPYIFVPTGFTPNGDGENDILYVYGNGIDPDKEFYFAVYSRWGQMVFETTDPATGWDGTFKGEALPPDVFGYYLKCNCFNREEYFEKGNITLLR